jgi:hypothetical protein
VLPCREVAARNAGREGGNVPVEFATESLKRLHVTADGRFKDGPGR